MTLTIQISIADEISAADLFKEFVSFLGTVAETACHSTWSL